MLICIQPICLRVELDMKRVFSKLSIEIYFHVIVHLTHWDPRKALPGCYDNLE